MKYQLRAAPDQSRLRALAVQVSAMRAAGNPKLAATQSALSALATNPQVAKLKRGEVIVKPGERSMIEDLSERDLNALAAAGINAEPLLPHTVTAPRALSVDIPGVGGVVTFYAKGEVETIALTGESAENLRGCGFEVVKVEAKKTKKASEE